MINLDRLLKEERTCKSLTGMSKQEFLDLSIQFEKALYIHQKERMGRKRAVGGGRRGKLPTAKEKLAFILIYLKVYPTFDVIALLTHRARSKCCESVKKLLPILERVLKHACVLPKRRITSASDFFQAFPAGKDIFLDGSERRIERPSKHSKRKKLYSGKKKCCTRKNIIAVDDKKRIGFLTPTKSGRRHDKRLTDKSLLFNHVPDDITIWADTGFQGMYHSHANAMLPIKASKNKKLSEKEKQHNQLVSSFRCIVEHAIGGYKRLKAACDIYRNRRPNLDDTFHLVAAGLWNFHLQYI